MPITCKDGQLGPAAEGQPGASLRDTPLLALPVAAVIRYGVVAREEAYLLLQVRRRLPQLLLARPPLALILRDVHCALRLDARRAGEGLARGADGHVALRDGAAVDRVDPFQRVGAAGQPADPEVGRCGVRIGDVAFAGDRPAPSGCCRLSARCAGAMRLSVATERKNFWM